MHEKGTIVGGFGERAPGGLRGGSIGGGYHLPPPGGLCEGTEQRDFITGTDVRDVIFALGGFDFVDARDGEDEINGQNGGDFVRGGNDNDTYNGGNGQDVFEELLFDQPGPATGRDVMNGGPEEDGMEAGLQADILRGQAGDECGFGIEGDEGNDDIFGGTGEDCLFGDEGTDEHFGGADNDFIDAVSQDRPETGPPLSTRDVVDCGRGVDTAVVRRDEDAVRNNCENVIDLSSSARVAAYDERTAEEQQQLFEAFIAEHGLAAEPGS